MKRCYYSNVKVVAALVIVAVLGSAISAQAATVAYLAIRRQQRIGCCGWDSAARRGNAHPGRDRQQSPDKVLLRRFVAR